MHINDTGQCPMGHSFQAVRVIIAEWNFGFCADKLSSEMPLASSSMSQVSRASALYVCDVMMSDISYFSGRYAHASTGGFINADPKSSVRFEAGN